MCRQHSSCAGKGVDLGSRNVRAAIEADIGITEIINQKDDDVGAFGRSDERGVQQRDQHCHRSESPHEWVPAAGCRWVEVKARRQIVSHSPVPGEPGMSAGEPDTRGLTPHGSTVKTENDLTLLA